MWKKLMNINYTTSDSEEDDNDHSNFVQENIKNNYQTSFRFI